MAAIRLCTLLACVLLACAQARAAAVHLTAPDARTVDGGSYYGPLVDSKMHGRGRVEWPNGAYYEGSFERGLLRPRRAAAGGRPPLSR